MNGCSLLTRLIKSILHLQPVLEYNETGRNNFHDENIVGESCFLTAGHSNQRRYQTG